MLISHWPVKLSVFLMMAVVPVIAQQEPAKKAAETAKEKVKAKATGKAKAQGPNAKAFQKIVVDLDTNQDETLQRSEVPESARKEFDSLLKLMDENGDKALSRGELQASGAKLQKIFAANAPSGQPSESGPMMNAERLKRLDKNGDGFISKDEFPNGPPPFFDRFDLNKDGKIGPVELQAMVSTQPISANAGPGNDPESRLKQMDKDSDGKISRQEWAGAEGMFKRMDKDGDGSLSEAEQKNAVNAMKKAAEKSKKKAE